jgi:hypothetical protein
VIIADYHYVHAFLAWIYFGIVASQMPIRSLIDFFE